MTPAPMPPALMTFSRPISSPSEPNRATPAQAPTDRSVRPGHDHRLGRSRLLRGVAALACTVALAACGSAATPGGSAGPQDTTGAAAGSTSAVSPGSADAAGSASRALVVEEAWAVARPSLTPMPMTAVFATARNPSDREVVITAATTDASDHTELHTTVTATSASTAASTSSHADHGTSTPADHGTMRNVDRLTVPAGGTLTLRPGGDHVMVMAMRRPLPAGTPVGVTLTTADGAKLRFTAVAKPFTGAQEPYHATDAPTHGSHAPQPSASGHS